LVLVSIIPVRHRQKGRNREREKIVAIQNQNNKYTLFQK